MNYLYEKKYFFRYTINENFTLISYVSKLSDELKIQNFTIKEIIYDKRHKSCYITGNKRINIGTDNLQEKYKICINLTPKELDICIIMYLNPCACVISQLGCIFLFFITILGLIIGYKTNIVIHSYLVIVIILSELIIVIKSFIPDSHYLKYIKRIIDKIYYELF